MIRKRIIYAVSAVIGALLLLSGVFLHIPDSMRMLSGLCFGFGAAALVLGLGFFLDSVLVSAAEDERIKRIKAIEVNDERNIRIREKTGYMVSKVMNYVLCVFILILGFMNAGNVIIILAATMLLTKFVLAVAFSNYYSKKI